MKKGDRARIQSFELWTYMTLLNELDEKEIKQKCA